MVFQINFWTTRCWLNRFYPWQLLCLFAGNELPILSGLNRIYTSIHSNGIQWNGIVITMFIYRINEANSSNSFSRGFPSHSIMSSLVCEEMEIRHATKLIHVTNSNGIEIDLRINFIMVEIAFSLTRFFSSLPLFYSTIKEN